MKRKTILNVAIFATLVSMVFIGCDREEAHVDYRDKYTGEWRFDVVISEFNMVDSFYYGEDFNYVGEISLGQLENELEIHYLENISVSLAIDEDGILSGFSSPHSSGEFEDSNHIRIFIRWGGLGGGGSHSITGIR